MAFFQKLTTNFGAFGLSFKTADFKYILQKTFCTKNISLIIIYKFAITVHLEILSQGSQNGSKLVFNFWVLVAAD